MFSVCVYVCVCIADGVVLREREVGGVLSASCKEAVGGSDVWWPRLNHDSVERLSDDCLGVMELDEYW